MTWTRALVLTGLISIAGLAWWLDIGHLVNLETLRNRQQEIVALVNGNPFLAAALFFASYVLVAVLNIPGAVVMTLAAGALFGLMWGTVIASFASTIGACGSFLLSRFLLRDFVEKRFGNAVARVNSGIKKDGSYYLFGLRLVPAFPFFVINMVMGLTRIRLGSFYWVSQLGMLPATLLFVNAGTQLATIESPAGIISPRILASFALLGIFPLAAGKISAAIFARKPAPSGTG